jgi:DNA replication protein DnaC
MTSTEFADSCRGDFGLPEYLADDFLVAIDDLGAARDTTNFVADAIYRLANSRIGRWTIFTSNLNLADVATKIDERVASRMIRDRNVVHRIAAGDYAMSGRKI